MMDYKSIYNKNKLQNEAAKSLVQKSPMVMSTALKASSPVKLSPAVQAKGTYVAPKPKPAYTPPQQETLAQPKPTTSYQATPQQQAPLTPQVAAPAPPAAPPPAMAAPAPAPPAPAPQPPQMMPNPEVKEYDPYGYQAQGNVMARTLNQNSLGPGAGGQVQRPSGELPTKSPFAPPEPFTIPERHNPPSLPGRQINVDLTPDTANDWQNYFDERFAQPDTSAFDYDDVGQNRSYDPLQSNMGSLQRDPRVDDILSGLLSGPRDTTEEKNLVEEKMMQEAMRGLVDNQARFGAMGMGTSGALANIDGQLRRDAGRDIALTQIGIDRDSRAEDLQRQSLGLSAERSERQFDFDQGRYQDQFAQNERDFSVNQDRYNDSLDSQNRDFDYGVHRGDEARDFARDQFDYTRRRDSEDRAKDIAQTEALMNLIGQAYGQDFQEPSSGDSLLYDPIGLQNTGLVSTPGAGGDERGIVYGEDGQAYRYNEESGEWEPVNQERPNFSRRGQP